MALLGSTGITDEQRIENSAHHRPLVVLAVLGVLLVYAYLFTDFARALHLPPPQELAAGAGVVIEQYVFDPEGRVYCELRTTYSRRPLEQQRLTLFGVVAAAFLSAYFLPLRFKPPSLVLWTLAAVLVLYGPGATATLIAAHLGVYLVLHPGHRRGVWIAAAAGLLGVVGSAPHAPPLVLAATAALAAAVVSLLYRFVLLRLLAHPRLAGPIRTLVVQSAVVTILLGLATEALTGRRVVLTVGILLFFWMWARLMLYHVDYKDGAVPRDVPLLTYLSIFLSPAVFVRVNWGNTTGQGYAYTTNSFLREDKNRLAIAGLRLWGVALLYLVFGYWLTQHLTAWLGGAGLLVYPTLTELAQRHVAGQLLSAPTVMFSAFLDQVRWFLLFAAVMHFKVGVWRVCGYAVDPYFNKPWLATNLVTFWARFTFHYREFLVRAFYYPWFFRLRGVNKWVRIFVATMMAAAVGNMFWGRIPRSVYRGGLTLDNVAEQLRIWPYFVMLGVGISVTELYLTRRKRRRRPWSRDWRIVLDVLALYCTVQYYALCHILLYLEPGESVADAFRLLLLAFGIRI